MQGVKIGDIVLYRIGEELRPMIVTIVWSQSCVNGILILDALNDSNLNVPVTREGHCMAWVTSVPYGLKSGEWKFKE